MASRASRGRGRGRGQSKSGRRRGRNNSLRSHRSGVPRTQTSMRKGAGRVARKLRNQAQAAKLSGNAFRYVEDADEETNDSQKYLENYTKSLFDLVREEDATGASTPALFKLEEGDDAEADVTGELDMEALEEALSKLPFHECIDIDYTRFPDLRPSNEKKKKPTEKETRKTAGLRYVQPPDWLLPKQKAETKPKPKPSGEDIDALISQLSSDGKLSRTQFPKQVTPVTSTNLRSEKKKTDLSCSSPIVPNQASGQKEPFSNSQESPAKEESSPAMGEEKVEPDKPSPVEVKSPTGILNTNTTARKDFDTTGVTSLLDKTVLKPQFQQKGENQIDDELNDLLGF